jgi:hypothetical protein
MVSPAHGTHAHRHAQDMRARVFSALGKLRDMRMRKTCVWPAQVTLVPARVMDGAPNGAHHPHHTHGRGACRGMRACATWGATFRNG